MVESRPDKLIFTLTLVLALLGVLMVFNASTYAGKRLFNNPDHFLVRQALSALLGIVVMILLVFVPYQRIRALTPAIVLGSLLLLLLVLIPGIGKIANNARRWLSLGPFQFQPSEFAKLAVILYLSSILAKKKARGVTATFRGFLPPLLILLAFFALVFMEPDLSTAAILLFTGMTLFFAGGVPLGHLLGLGLSSLPFIIVLVFSRGYMRSRLFAHIDPLKDASSRGYHILQSLLSFQNGGLFGRGLGNGTQKMGPLPEAHTDFILPAHAEEIGFFGLTFILIILFLLVSRVFRIAAAVDDDFARLFCYGVAVLVSWQALINVAVVSGLLPATGLPFPFLSAGGSSLLMLCAATGIVMNISKHIPQGGARSWSV